MASSGPIWTAWPVLPVSRRASTSATPFVDLAGTHFPFFCCSPEAWGGILLRLSPSFMKTSLVTSSRWRDLHWLRMFSWQRVWGLLPFQVFLGYPLGDLRVDLTQLFFMESPNQIAWHLMPWTIWFTFFVFVCRWDLGSKYSAAQDITSRCCSCDLPNCDQALCCLLFLCSY